MNKWAELLLGLILVIVAIVVAFTTHGIGRWDFGSAAWMFLKGGLFWLVLGGGFYTAGAAVFNMKRFNITPQFGAHEIWHLFVAAGSFSHFWMMLKYVLYLD